MQFASHRSPQTYRVSLHLVETLQTDRIVPIISLVWKLSPANGVRHSIESLIIFSSQLALLIMLGPRPASLRKQMSHYRCVFVKATHTGSLHEMARQVLG
jgi:hypothetical protein